MQYQFGPGPLQADYDPMIQKLKSDIGIVEDTDIAQHAIAQGQYVIWHGNLYIAQSDIQSGSTLSSSNLTVKLNGLGGDVASQNAALAKLDSTNNYTNDILADALNCTATTFFHGGGVTYTGTLPSTNYAYGSFVVQRRAVQRTVLAISNQREIAINYYNGSAWGGWKEYVSKTESETVETETISLGNYASDSDQRITVHKRNGVVTVRVGALKGSAITQGSWFTLTTLDSKWRPAGLIETYLSAGTQQVRFNISASGDLKVFRYSNETGNIAGCPFLTYVAAN